MTESIELQLAQYQSEFQQFIPTLLGPIQSEFAITTDHRLTELFEALEYSCSNGGKRVRPFLTLATFQALGHTPSTSIKMVAGAVEFAHCYSLVHDDLPAMDDDDMRRGKPSCHRAFSEATAILVGDGLQARAFELITTADFSAQQKISMVQTLAAALGPRGMVGGQFIDVCSVGVNLEQSHLESMHRLKTGALIRAAVLLGAHAGAASSQLLHSLDQYAQNLGLCFQVVDDVLDVVGSSESLGKTQGKDEQRGKPTYTQLLGLEGAKQTALELKNNAIAAISDFPGSADTLRDLAEFVVQRQH